MRKFIYSLLIICTFFFSGIDVYASTTTYDRNEKSNLGVNKKWTIDDSNRANVLNTPLVDATEKIYDYSDILTDSEESILYDKIQEFIKETKMDLVFVTVNMPYYSDSENEEYAADFYDYNDFGIDFEGYDGVLLLRNTYSSNPYYNIYTFGDSQLYFPFERCESILDSIYSNFSTHNYMPGYERVISSLTSYYDSGIPYEYRNYYIDDMGYMKKGYSYPLIIIPISIGITAIVISILISKNKMVKKATKAEEYLDSKSIGYSERRDEFIRSYTTHYTVSSSSGGSRSGGGGSRSGSSGGGHGGGGGRHG